MGRCEWLLNIASTLDSLLWENRDCLSSHDFLRLKLRTFFTDFMALDLQQKWLSHYCTLAQHWNDDWEAFSEKEWQYLTFLIKVYKDRKVVFMSILYIEHGWDMEKMSLPAQRPCVPCITLLYILPIPSLSIIQGQNVPPLWQSGGSLTFSCWIFQSW